MTREEAIKYLRINAQMRMALETLVPEIKGPEIKGPVYPVWVPCEKGQRFKEESLVKYPAYCEISWAARADGYRIPIDVLRRQLPTTGVPFDDKNDGTNR